jgi:hypothetical protein
MLFSDAQNREFNILNAASNETQADFVDSEAEESNGDEDFRESTSVQRFYQAYDSFAKSKKRRPEKTEKATQKAKRIKLEQDNYKSAVKLLKEVLTDSLGNHVYDSWLDLELKRYRGNYTFRLAQEKNIILMHIYCGIINN